jgi:hypothetical protein
MVCRTKYSMKRTTKLCKSFLDNIEDNLDDLILGDAVLRVTGIVNEK